MTNRLSIYVLKYSFLSALYFLTFIALTLMVGNSNTSLLAAAEEQVQQKPSTKESRKKAKYFEQFHYSQMKLDEWSPIKFTDDITESEIGFSIGLSELSGFAEILQRAMYTSETQEQKDRVHRFATVLEKKQRSFLTSARLFTERRLNHYLSTNDVRAYVPPMRNSILEIHGPNLDTAINRQNIIGRYKAELYLARFKQIVWKPSPDGKHIEETRMNSFGDGMFFIDRSPGANKVFDYHN